MENKMKVLGISAVVVAGVTVAMLSVFPMAAVTTGGTVVRESEIVQENEVAQESEVVQENEVVHENEVVQENEVVHENEIVHNLVEQTRFYRESFVLSVSPGFHDEAFDLIVSIPTKPNAVIYYTIDGNEPQPGSDRFITRGANQIQVSGRIPENGQIRVEDRSGYWGHSILTHHHANRFNTSTRPGHGAGILQGTAFRFRGFVDGEPVTETFTATYIVAPNAGERFANRPIVAVTAPYEDFIYIYSNAERFDPVTRRRTFNYEYFEYGENGYNRIFSLPGSSQLGGNGTRNFAQRTINVHLSRGELDGVVTHPVFTGLYELYRFRLWNSGNSFHWDHMRDIFAQTASAGLNVPRADHSIAIKFINGEYWGFTTIREHTSNSHFASTRLGIDRDNIALLSRTWNNVIMFSEIEEGDEDVVTSLYGEIAQFVRTHDLSTDHAREILFTEFFCQENFMDYLIANTFFNNSDWPNNNMRYFRAINPDPTSDNPYNDGRWRFIFHDMDWAPRPGTEYTDTRFPSLYRWNPHYLPFNSVFLVFNNRTFVEQFRERAFYVLDNHFQTDRLLALHLDFVVGYLPLLEEMYHRFPIHGSVQRSLANFNNHSSELATFLENREYHYRKQLDALLERVS